MIASAVIVLPHPDSPTSAKVSPRSITRSMPSTARRVPASVANSTQRPSTESSAGPLVKARAYLPTA
jgi:hypothetical protein